MRLAFQVTTLIVSLLMAFFSVPTAKADPLTIVAIIGISTVVVASAVDIAIPDEDAKKDMMAEMEGSGGRSELSAARSAQGPSDAETETAAPQTVTAGLPTDSIVVKR